MANLILNMEKKLLRTFWVIPGFINSDGSLLEQTYISNMETLKLRPGTVQEQIETVEFLEQPVEDALENISHEMENISLEMENISPEIPQNPTPAEPAVKLKQKSIKDFFNRRS